MTELQEPDADGGIEEMSNKVLLHYAQRFAKSSDETVKIEDFDASGYKWNVHGILGYELPCSEPVRRMQNYSFHQMMVSLPTTPAQLTHSREVEEASEGCSRKSQHSSFPKGKIKDSVDLPMGQAPRLMSGQMPSAARCAGSPKNLTLRVPLPGAPPNQTICPKVGKGAGSKGSSKGRPGQMHTANGKTTFWEEFCTMQVTGKRAQTPVQQTIPKLFDLDGVSTMRCSFCRLPLGDHGYMEDGHGTVHGECMAQLLLRNLCDEEDCRNQKDEKEKIECRKEYDIGWKVERVPRNIGLQSKLKGMIISHGMTCLVLNDESRSVRFAPTRESSAAVNLEYLSIALQIRRKEGREPLFSLDPVNPTSHNTVDKNAVQVKRFEPEWLAGTSAGDVLFQADYHLKELSMGEYEQPVVGMKSCFDYSQEEEFFESWSAREWFLVRKAEVHLSEDGVLIPMVKMGVEAREQNCSNGHLVDAPITRQGHPMVKYAESFTKNFDLIAERKSVVYHLRELAKASVLAKFLVDSEMQVEESWFSLAGEAEEASAMEIPQLWNERMHSRISVHDGEILDKHLGTKMYGVYGGVQFGLDKFAISAVQPRKTLPSVIGPISSTLEPTSAALQVPPTGVPRRGLLAGGVLARQGIPTSVATAPLSGTLAQFSTKPLEAAPILAPTGVRAPLAAGIAGIMPSAPRITPPLTSLSSIGAPLAGAAASLAAGSALSAAAGPRGVDLNLNQFSLDTVERSIDGNWVGEPLTEDAANALTSAFWSCIDSCKDSPFDQEDLSLLKSVFNPNLSDRRADADIFAPPDTSISSISKLRSLVQDEEEVRRRRKDYFFSTSFRFDKPGPLFPSSWTSSLGVAGAKTSDHVLSGIISLQARTNYKDEADDVLKSASPAFHRKTEEGMSFRIYRVGSLEVRTTQEHDGEESIGAVFSVRTNLHSGGSHGAARCAAGHERIIKVIEYVQKVSRGGGDYRYYIVFQTEHGHAILSEQLADGLVSWEENLSDLEDRNSLAKVIRSASCRAGVTVQDMRAHRAQVLQACNWSSERGQNYATSAFVVAVGGPEEVVKAAEIHARDLKLREAKVKAHE